MTATVAAPATKPVAASAATCRAGTAGPAGSRQRLGVDDGQAVDDLASSGCRVGPGLHEVAVGRTVRQRASRRRLGAVPNTWSQ